MNLELFMTTMREYERFVVQLPLSKNENNPDLFNEFEYVSVQTRLMLLRKYIAKGNVVIDNIIKESKDEFPEKTNFLDDLLCNYINIKHNKSFEHILSDGTKYNIYNSIEDILYGLYLHAEADRIERLSKTKENYHYFLTKKFVNEIEAILYKLFNFLKKNNIAFIEETIHEKAPVIHLGSNNLFEQRIKLSPYWNNLYGHDLSDDEINNRQLNFTLDDYKVGNVALLFIDELLKENISVESLNTLIDESTIDDWGDFSVIAKILKNIPDFGFREKILYNDNNDVAWVFLIPNVVNAFQLDSTHFISEKFQVITLTKDYFTNQWKVYAFGKQFDPYKP